MPDKVETSLYGMESHRILLSNRVHHKLELPEMSMGVICHALDVLAIAFSQEPQYRGLIARTKLLITAKLETPPDRRS